MADYVVSVIIENKPGISDPEGETILNDLVLKGKNTSIKKIRSGTILKFSITERNESTAKIRVLNICDEMRITVSNSLKYFCISEAVSYYLQKYIAYRKRKIYSANNNFLELIDLMEKHSEDNFLLVSSDFIKSCLDSFIAFK